MRDVPVLVPETLDEACAALDSHPDATLMAGGTDLMVGINAGRVRPGHIIAIGRLNASKWFNISERAVTFDAGMPYSAMTKGHLADLVPILAQAARTIGSPQIRNAGTLGGNLGTASPAGDGVAALVALDAHVSLRSVGGTRTVAAADFVTGPRATVRAPNEIITHISVPVLHGPQEFLKVGTRNAMVIAVASAALVVDPSERVIRLALGSVGPKVLRCPAAEEFATAHVDWDSLRSDGESAAEFGRLAATEARPIDDHRSTAAYRRHAVAVIARRAFERAFVADRDVA
jgi:CO/xanthine dehydrogenase FAD-binding subunit